ncbi:MAG TPA: GNAT family N-acetyltransferase [Candidatus Dormibacteraeota bacterium]|nr:GNAT family N-acetyltransferase [Candidatus Dormibacteraeota bacterium]
MAGITYRDATLDDAELAADIMTSSYPALAQDPVITRYRWEQPRHGYEIGRFIAEREGRPLGFLSWMHGPWADLPERHCEIEVWLDRSMLGPDLLKSMWAWIEARAIAEDSGVLIAYAGEDEPEMLEVLAALGYGRDRLDRVWALDLAVHGKRLVDEALQARDRMRVEGIELVTLATWKDPAAMRRLHELNRRTVQDMPHTLPILDEPLADFERRVSSPDRRADRLWVALVAGQPVAMSYLKFPPVRGRVFTGYTCSDPAHRGRGIARAVKLQTLAQAVELGVPVVYTDNDSENAPMLHINETLGYRLRPGFVQHLKRVTT